MILFEENGRKVEDVKSNGKSNDWIDCEDNN